MAFEPTKPTANTLTDAVEMRSQLNALNDNHTALAAQVANLPTVDDLTDAVNTYAPRNVDSLATLSLTISNPPTQAQVQAIVTAYNTLLLALKH